MDPRLVDRWSDLLVDYCLAVTPGETIGISADLAARPLVEACYRGVVSRGGLPYTRVELPGLTDYFLANASDAQLSLTPEWAVREAELTAGRIRIAADVEPAVPAVIDPRRQGARERAMAPVREAARENRWALTQFPTPLYAKDAGMTLADYTDFVTRALFLDQPDPAEAWRALGRRQAGLVEYMKGVRSIRVEAPGTDITLSVVDRVWINSDGRRNMPSAEIFTGPHEESAQGRITCEFPVRRGGREIVGVELDFQDGAVVAARADQGEDYLLAMLDIDAGARRLGELGLGLNQGIDRFTGSILFDEKMGGTIHLALGQSYPETGGVNKSALHWDLIVDTRRDGRITADGITVMENGRWRVG